MCWHRIWRNGLTLYWFIVNIVIESCTMIYSFIYLFLIVTRYCYKSKYVQLLSYMTLHLINGIGGERLISGIIFKTNGNFIEKGFNRKQLRVQTEQISMRRTSKTVSFVSSTGDVQTRRRSISIVGVINGRCTNKKVKTFRC